MACKRCITNCIVLSAMKLKLKLSIFTLFLTAISHLGYSQISTNFWFAAPDLQQLHNDRPIFLRIAAFKTASTVTISIPANPAFTPITVNVNANTSTSVDLTSYIDLIENGIPNTTLRKGLHVTATNAISCYYDIASTNNGDMYALKGNNALGKKFTLPFQMAYTNWGLPNYTCDFIIVATEDNTNISINPKYNLVGHAAGIPFNISLNKGETYVLSAMTNNANERIGGSIVTSDKPIAISTKDDSVSVPGENCKDAEGDQLIPDEIAGQEFIVIKGYLNSPDNYYVFAIENGTTVSVNGSSVATLNAGEYYRGTLSDISVFIQTSNPSHLYQLSGFGCEVGGAVIPSIKCTGSNAVNVTRAASNESFFLNLLAPVAIIGNFKLNGSNTLVDPTQFQPVTGSNGTWMYARIPIPLAVAAGGQTILIENDLGKFHTGIIQGGQATTARFGYFSNFGSNQIDLNDLTNNSSIYNNDKIICFNTDVNINVINTEANAFTWTGPNGFSSNGSLLNISKFKTTDTGSYVITTQSNSCGLATKTIHLSCQKPIADFQTKQTGCISDSVYISTDTTAAVRWIWNLGDGRIIDTTKGKLSPVRYSLPNDYRIGLKIVSSLGCFSEDSIKTISISSKPVAGFSIPNIKCVNQDIIFTDVSTNVSGKITKWFWNLDDGNGQRIMSVNSNQTARYLLFGTKRASLFVESYAGCRSDTFLLSPSLIIDPIPDPGFIMPEVCLNDASAVFTDTSKSADGSTNFTYAWNFNDGPSPVSPAPTYLPSALTEKNPSPRYYASGIYKVSLTVTSKGCSKKITSDFTVNGANPVPVLSITPSQSFCSNDSVRVQNFSTVDFGVVTRLEIFWDQNNLSLKTIDENPFIGKTYAFRYSSFSSPSTSNRIVKLVAYSGNALSCSKSITQTIVLNASPAIQFQYIPGICLDAIPRQITQAGTDMLVPGNYVFSGVGINANGIFDPAAAGIGTHTIKYLYTATTTGCKDSSNRDIMVWDKPVSDFSMSALHCEDNMIDLANKSTTRNGVISKFHWAFGDGNTQLLYKQDTAHHIYMNAGNFNPTLIAETDSGCMSAPFIQPLVIHPLPIPSFSIPTVCLPAGKALFINNTSMSDGTGGLLTYLWNFGDKNDLNPSVSKNGQHNYLQLGAYDVKLIATSIDGCKDSLTQKLTSVYAQPKASLLSSDSLCLGTAVGFMDKSITANGTIQGWFWDFGDGSTSISSNPIHVYNSSGAKNIRFYAQASTSCYTDTISKTIMVYDYPKISAGPDLDVLNDGQKKIQSTATGTMVAFRWDTSLYLSNSTILQPYVVKPQIDMEYHLTVTGRGNCISRDTILIRSVTMPKPSNTFTPNGDGYNDVWEIKYLDQYPNGILEIYTTTGQLILRSIGYPQPWDGTINGNPLPAGTYYYVIDTRNGKPKMAGYITIIR